MSSAYNPKICIIGGGFSGVCAGIKLQEELEFDNFTIYDENQDFGGIWLTHTYPGCACDVPSLMYSYSFELNPEWSTTYAKQAEIKDYLKNVAGKYELYSKAKFFHRVESATWDESNRDWKVVVQDLRRNEIKEIRYDIIICGTGPFRTPNIPEKFLSFKGPVIHSAKWDSSVALEDKVVAIIGSGASAVQIIPQIAPKVKKLVSFQRNPAWVPPQQLYKIPGFVQKALKNVPYLMRLARIVLFFVLDFLAYQAFKAKGLMVDFATKVAEWNMNRQIPDPEMRAKLKPAYRFGCKRVTPSSKYYKALSRPNCEVVRTEISEVKSDSIVTTDGKEYEIDVLILGTGYHIHDFWLPMIVKGKSSEDALEYFNRTGCAHYLGVVSSEFPNSFLLLGPNSGYGHNSVVFSIECQMDWVVKVLKEMKRKRARYVQVTEEAERSYRNMINEKTKDFVWGSYSCGSWYIDKNGVNVAIYPGNLTSFWNQTRKVDLDKLIME